MRFLPTPSSVLQRILLLIPIRRLSSCLYTCERAFFVRGYLRALFCVRLCGEHPFPQLRLLTILWLIGRPLLCKCLRGPPFPIFIRSPYPKLLVFFHSLMLLCYFHPNPQIYKLTFANFVSLFLGVKNANLDNAFWRYDLRVFAWKLAVILLSFSWTGSGSPWYRPWPSCVVYRCIVTSRLVSQQYVRARLC